MTPAATPLDPIDTAGIAALLGVCRRHVTERLTKQPSFPRPIIDISAKTRRWSRAQVLEWARGGKRAA